MTKSLAFKDPINITSKSSKWLMWTITKTLSKESQPELKIRNDL